MLQSDPLHSYSILDLKSNDHLHKNIFKIINEDKFVQFKLTPIEIKNETMHMLQIVDISSSIIKQ